MARKDTFDFDNEVKEIEIDDVGENAIIYAQYGQSFFLTGKAGTGKTTLIHYLQSKIISRTKIVAIVAPTGIAARNAGGVTIHSFLHLPLTIYLPTYKVKKLYKLDRAAQEMIRNLDILIIDEISMVRCDVFDMMNLVLQHYRGSEEPFGGIQVILVGDLYQLMPVVKDKDWEKLKLYYDTTFFFSSKAFQEMNCPMLELTTVHRQKGASRAARDFIDLLNNVRIGNINIKQLETLTDKYYKFKEKKYVYKNWIHVTTHRYIARRINDRKLKSIRNEKEYTFIAQKEGYFPYEDFPTEENLRLKVRARVMFVKNERTGLYQNGTMGTVTSIYGGEVTVRVDGSNSLVTVSQETWENQDYIINRKTKEIQPRVCGTFKQIPLKLAWAITVHKSQGLTFDKAVIDVSKAFTGGQVYVALSRCKELKMLRLASEITKSNIMVDPHVEKFYREQEKKKYFFFPFFFFDEEDCIEIP